MRLILASTSPYRRELLQRLGLPFECIAPDANESALPDETPMQLVERLAQVKATAVAAANPDALIIGSDQVAVCGDQVLGKPGDHARAHAQLSALSGRRVSFLTGLCLLNAGTGARQVEVVPFHVQFRHLGSDMIDRYLRREQPYNCAGSFKSEGLGSALFERLEGNDPTALIGLPLIRLTRMLETEGMVVI